MPKLTKSYPKYRKHRASGQAVVTLAGSDHYLGKFDTPASRKKYDRLIAQWSCDGRPTQHIEPHEFTVAELISAFWRFAKQHYRRSDGTPTGTANRIKFPLRMLREHYGTTAVIDFGPLSLKHLQRAGIEAGHSRSYINDNIGRIQSVFKWGVSEEFFDESIYRRLMSVRPLQRGKSAAKETKPIQPVDQLTVEKTCLELNEVVADMVFVQLRTGARPGEICIMRPMDIDRSREVWVYWPNHHKTEHHGIEHAIAIGPDAQQVLAKYIDRAPSEYLFTPDEGLKAHLQCKAAERVTPASSGTKRCAKRAVPRKTLHESYSVASYRRAIHRACDRAFPLPDPLGKRPGESEERHRQRLTTEQMEMFLRWRKKHRCSQISFATPWPLRLVSDLE